jgi:hypothetical protein
MEYSGSVRTGLSFGALALAGACATGPRQPKLHVEGAWAFASSTTSDRHFLMGGLAAATVPVNAVVEVGIEGLRETSYDRVCAESCGLQFPTIYGAGIPVSVRIADRIDIGAGPGVYHRFLNPHDVGSVGGLTAHAALRLVSVGPVGLTASARPLLTFGPRLFTGERIGLIAYALGLRW